MKYGVIKNLAQHRQKFHYAKPKVCYAQVLLDSGRIVSIMYGVAFNGFQRQLYYEHYMRTIGQFVNWKNIVFAKFKTEKL